MAIRYEKLTLDNYLKNRTIVSDDIESILLDIGKEVGLPIKIHHYPTGTDVGSWVVPEAWNVREAWIKAPDGSIVSSYDEHPLFLVPYSSPFDGIVNLTELREHVRFHPIRPNDFYYEHRFAYDFHKRLSDWAFSLPRNRFEALPEGNYEVHLDISIEKGDMLVGEINLPGKTNDTIALLTDYCHPGQVNDSWSGILAMIDVIKSLSATNNRHHSYKLFIFPETIGSCIFLESNTELIDSIKLAIFSDFVGWGFNWRLFAGDRIDGLAKSVAKIAVKSDSDFSIANLHEAVGNDEFIFDYVGIPALSVMAECDEYHSSSDRFELLEQDNIDKAVKMIIKICQIMDINCAYQFRQRVPVYMTRYKLYDDAVTEKALFTRNRKIINGLNDGFDIIKICDQYELNFDEVGNYIDRLLSKNLIKRI